MTGVPKKVRVVVLLAALPLVGLAGCGDAPRSPVSPSDGVALYSKPAASSTVSVKSSDPAFGDQGQVNETVTISGSGFKAGASMAYLHNGQVDPTITVSSVQVTSSSTLVAVISIAPNSPLDFRDIQVTNSDRTQGIGSAVFEVTQARLIAGTFAARGANDSGEITGQLANGGAFYFDVGSGLLQPVSTIGSGYSINPLGNTIAGGGGTNGPAMVYMRAGSPGSAWSATTLPMDSKAIGGTADAMMSDPATGQATLLGGLEALPTLKGAACSNAVLWSWQPSTSTWLRILLPKNGGCQAAVRPRGLSANGVAVGSIDNVAAVWTANGSGGYTLTLLDGAYANGIDGGASMIVGDKSASHTQSVAIYWLASNGVWGKANTFPGGCSSSRDIADASGRVTLNDCPFSGSSVLYAAYMDAPYSAPIRLGGVGGHNTDFVGGISPSGAYMVGNASSSGGVQVGVYWKP